MPLQPISSIENNFTKGLVTESTGLNFPENAATDTDNCVYNLVGDVTRRLGINTEQNGIDHTINRIQWGVNSYVWSNPGGDGNTQIIVTQSGVFLHFYRADLATATNPLSTQQLSTVINFSGYVASGGTLNSTKECQFADGNGYLLVTHPDCEPFYCIYSPNTSVITTTSITIQTRDFVGTSPTEMPINFRPGSLTLTHQYNIQNQGWNSSADWSASSVSGNAVGVGVRAFDVGLGLPITQGQTIGAIATAIVSSGVPGSTSTYYTMIGNVLSYNAGILSVYVGTYDTTHQGTTYVSWTVSNLTGGSFPRWFSQVGSYPSNADVWWNYKDDQDLFNPASTLNSTTLNSGPAPKGGYILSEFNQDRSTVSGLAPGIQIVKTTFRPKTVAWHAGRAFYTGVDAPNDNATNYSWSENIYFSQVITDVSKFGYCYKQNDPTSSELFDDLPTDGGVITIQGCGSIYRLFPIQNGLLVFAAKGIWFITGSQGIGFAANDYTITKISSVQSISSTSFVDVQGLPYFWNEEGIYRVTPAQQGGLTVEPITVGTILTFYESIPKSSKKFARGAYHPIDYTIQWVYRSTEAGDTTDAYTFDKVLVFNVFNKAFYPYTVSTAGNVPSINGIVYVASPGGTSTVTPSFKYICSRLSNTTMSFAEEYDTAYVDWGVSNYVSYFITGYKLHGQGQKRFQVPYLYTFSKNEVPTSFKVQSIWDYAVSSDSGRWSTAELVNNWSPNFGVMFRRHRLRGRGLVLQIKITSVDGKPFDIIGWSVYENLNSGV